MAIFTNPWFMVPLVALVGWWIYKQDWQVLESLNVGHLAERPPHRLSGGEKRMAALAGILVMRPEIVVLDEPSAALDPRARRRVIEVLRELDKPLILATHDLDMALDVCGRAVVLFDGRVAADREDAVERCL